MKKALLYFNNLETRERYILLIGIYAVIIIVGLFFITIPLYKKLQKIDAKIQKETENYTQLVKLASEYIVYKPKYKKVNLSLSFIENLAKETGIKENISSLKPVSNGVEVSFEQVNGENLAAFIQKIKKKNLKISSFYMEDIKGNGKLNVRLIVSE